jgi:hypothetical protein
MASVGFDDLSGNNPTHRLMDRPVVRSSPAVEYGVATDPSSVNVTFPKTCRSMWVATTGTIEAVDYRGNSAVFTGLTAGSILEVQAIGTLASGTTVTNIIPLF